VINKKLYVNLEELLFLAQNNYIKLPDEDTYKNIEIFNFYVYSYLRRTGKILTW
jgi:hypothetical protein